MLSISEQNQIHESLVISAQIGALEQVRKTAKDNASWIILREVQPEHFLQYEKMLAKKREELRSQITQLLEEKVIPAIREYLVSRYPERLPNAAEDALLSFDENLKIEIFWSPSNAAMIEKRPNNGWNKQLASYYFSNESQSRKVTLYVEEILQDFWEVYSQKELQDFLFQILLHEMVHSASTISYMSAEEEWIARKIRALRSPITGESKLLWEECAYRVGYGYNFVDANLEISDSDPCYQMLSTMPLNEGLTDLFASRIYRKYYQDHNWYSRKYLVSYQNELKAFFRAARRHAEKTWIPLDSLIDDIEKDFFFHNPEEAGFYSHIVPILEYMIEEGVFSEPSLNLEW